MLFSFNVKAAIEETEMFNSFVDKMVSQHQFNSAELKKLFQSVNIQQKIMRRWKNQQKDCPGINIEKYL